MVKPTSKLKNCCFTGVVVFAFLTIGFSPGIAVDKVNQSKSGVAIRGFDTVAFHTDKRAVKGKKEFSYQWNDATWYFKSAENRDLFAADPLRYAPQFGGN
jgi:YHS domain-containing protein